MAARGGIEPTTFRTEGIDNIHSKAEKQEGVAYRELLANLYQHLLEECLTADAADMNRPNYCPVNSSTQVAGQFPSQAYLFVYTISKSPKPGAGQQVSGDPFYSSRRSSRQSLASTFY